MQRLSGIPHNTGIVVDSVMTQITFLFGLFHDAVKHEDYTALMIAEWLCGELWRNDANGKKWRTQRRTSTSGTLSIINPTWTGQGSNLGLCSNRVANSHLTPITASCNKMWFYQNCDFSSHNKCYLTKYFLFVTGIQRQIGILFLRLMCLTTFASLKMGCSQDKEFSKSAVNFWKLCP